MKVKIKSTDLFYLIYPCSWVNYTIKFVGLGGSIHLELSLTSKLKFHCLGVCLVDMLNLVESIAPLILRLFHYFITYQ
jgi:hypothetical protein